MGMVSKPLSGRNLYRAAGVRELDRLAIEEHGIPGYELMTRAGAAVLAAGRAHFPQAREWLVLCGAGNNAGDGYVVARLAREQGLDVELLALVDPEKLSGDAARAAADWHTAGGETRPFEGTLPARSELIVDALLGTGLDREVEGVFLDAIEQANDRSCARLAVDVPSGLQADTGRIMGTAFLADLTVTFIGRKLGLYTAEGPDCAGRVLYDDLSTPPEIHADYAQAAGSEDRSGWLLDRKDLDRALPRRPRNSHKGSFGHVLVVGGNAGMSGAARLAGEAALRSGAGLVTVATHPAHASSLNLARPELMVRGIAEAEELAPVLERATVVALGPGLGQDEWGRELLDYCLAVELPLVLDADGLNLLRESTLEPDVGPEPASGLGDGNWRGDWILTPHPAEAARLLDTDTASVQADRLDAARRLARRYFAVVALKGCGTVLAHPSGAWALSPLGNPGMATGGTGDVLTGVIAGLLAQDFTTWEAACLGVTAHGAAGDLAAERGERGLLAGDITAHLPRVLNG